MNKFVRTINIRWADLDPNFHLRHSVYYDYGAYARVEFLQERGITAQLMQEYRFGPILFREECIFKKEIRAEDTITIDVALQKATPDFARWTIVHHLYRDADVLAARLTVDGAWMDVEKRKLTIPPTTVQEGFLHMVKAETFEWIIK